MSSGKEEQRKGEGVLITELEGMYVLAEQYCTLTRTLLCTQSLLYPTDRAEWSTIQYRKTKTKSVSYYLDYTASLKP